MVTENPTRQESELLPFAPTAGGKMVLAVIPLQMSNTVKIFSEQYVDGNPGEK
jgi:hypothetical protein